MAPVPFVEGGESLRPLWTGWVWGAYDIFTRRCQVGKQLTSLEPFRHVPPPKATLPAHLFGFPVPFSCFSQWHITGIRKLSKVIHTTRQIPSGVLVNIYRCLFFPLPRKSWSVAFADSHSINILTMAKFKILMWHLWMWSWEEMVRISLTHTHQN